ncbi:MAG: hypothetical protein CO186_00525 [Zetaproteobacteria bacterium CG_4_9_14_3_um_filter_49_83]|nr:MAG: hypothetical protein COW62_04735 [Zetaproteobacteria bacterium CG17_big_fil_post_rev_8_21_14_2_50_50_13]PIV30125.1 MAG: hypothetical protein COS35_08345 [Zetaproteobacteria bacterium CG02_land_8_20_14_3_00_50_9]PIY54544.1 MAG: hypothetical protein COZ00_14185 [Zetaproteobacteria bacterium CG_4_10_14_0_8_um_filter_49_80]PJA36461.1 MAG: hypothetical protein CO186_00525 [Zetaproteobacteria bacterium CG_4_9_14_3_um_filter_49_83]
MAFKEDSMLKWLIMVGFMLSLTGCYTLDKEHYESVVTTPSKIEKLEKTDEQLKQEIRSIKESLSNMEHTMEKEISANDVELKQTSPQKFMVTVKEQLLFNSGSADLNPQGRELIAKFAKAFEKAPATAHIRVVGHSDNRPVSKSSGYKDNWALSAARAAAVVRSLIWGEDIAPSRMHIEAYADTQPIAENTTEEGRAKNRRIDLFVEQG